MRRTTKVLQCRQEVNESAAPAALLISDVEKCESRSPKKFNQQRWETERDEVGEWEEMRCQEKGDGEGYTEEVTNRHRTADSCCDDPY